MFRNYFKIAIRNLLKQKSTSFINIFGLAMGMAVTMLIGLWIWDELSYDKYHKNYKDIAIVMQRYSKGAEGGVNDSGPLQLGTALRLAYNSYFRHVVEISGNGKHNISAGPEKLSRMGTFIGESGPELLSFNMLRGNYNGLKDVRSVMLSESLARSLFGTIDVLDKVVKIDNRLDVKVTGVYEDLPANTQYAEMQFVAPWKLYTTEYDWVKSALDKWDFNLTSVIVQIAPNQDMATVSDKIAGLKRRYIQEEDGVKADLFLFPMSRWHLYSNFENGKNVGGQIQFVWLFGTIGMFVLLLACINFMNLSTARSEKRAREVGIRKAIGSLRGQLVRQFFGESILVSLAAFVLSLVVVQLTLPWFNQVAGKTISLPWTNLWFWLASLSFSVFTGLIAGSYPAFYLSSFQPIRVLKGTFRAGRAAALPRKVLVVVQFTVSVLLISGTVIVHKQIQFAKHRPVGYDRSGLLSVQMTTPEIYQNYRTLQQQLMNSGVVESVSTTQGPLTNLWAWEGGFQWKDQLPGEENGFAVVGVEPNYGSTVKWQILQGRDFSKDFATDSFGIVLNEAAVKHMRLKNPVGETVTWKNQNYKVLGVVKNVIMGSPYEPVPRTVFYILKEGGNFVNVKLKPNVAVADAMKKISALFLQYNPAAPFEYSFADDDYARKFGMEERIGKLATFFATLAILISCLGLFGLASFLAEQRTKEIGIRKVLGASAFNVWRMLSRDFVILVLLSCCIATPVAWHFLHQWLMKYEYRTEITWWVFVSVGAGALFIALLTVSYQATKAALANPVKSLRSE